jgi:hypothetical protein
VNLENAISHIESALREEPSARRLCVRLIKRIAALPSAEMVTFGSMARMVNCNPADTSLHRCVTFLSTSPGCKALELHFLFLDEKLGEIEIDDQSVADAYENGVLIHPITGTEVPEFEAWLLPYFKRALDTPARGSQRRD